MPLPRFDKLDEPRRRAILAAAAKEFGDLGFEGASYNQIIKRAGISKGAMYYYFADKEDLFRTVLFAAIGEWVAEVGADFQADDASSFWAAIELLYARSLRFMLADRTYATLCLSVARMRTRHGGHPFLNQVNAQIHAWLSSLVTQGRNLGAVREDVPLDLQVHAALAVMDAGDNWLHDRWDEFREDDVERTAKMMVGMFRRLASPDADAPKDPTPDEGGTT